MGVKKMHEILVTRALANKVLVVAVINEDIRDWAAYIDAVPGKSHEQEKAEVARVGNKIPYEIAKILFPQIASEFQWRS
jgi:hypothetical protein